MFDMVLAAYQPAYRGEKYCAGALVVVVAHLSLSRLLERGSG